MPGVTGHRLLVALGGNAIAGERGAGLEGEAGTRVQRRAVTADA